MKRFVGAMLVLGCLVGSSDAFAEPPPLTVSVEGVATVGISKTATSTEANAAYRQGLAAAIADGLEKAEYLASKTGAKVGAIDQISEAGGSISCALHAEVGPLYEYEPYEGAPPDLGSAVGTTRVYEATPARAAAPSHATPTKKKKKRRKRKPNATRAAANGCKLSTQILLSYQLT